MSTRYIHCGSERFELSKFNPIKNDVYPWVKPMPKTGMWASRTDSKWGWIDWCENEDFRAEYYKSCSFEFTLSEDANVAYIYKPSDIRKLPMMCITDPFYDDSQLIYIDFEECLKEGIDAIEIMNLYGMDNPEDYMHTVYYALYGWDCESILILNPDIIKEV